MRVMRSVFGLILLTVVASPAPAQTFKFVSGNPYSNPTAWGARVGPYLGQLLAVPGQPTVDVYCVDYLHTVSTGQQWDASYSNMAGNLTATYGFARWGDQGITRERYEAAALLATKFSTQPKTEWGAIHGAIWNLMSDGTATYGSTTVGGGSAGQTYLSDALSAVAGGTDGVDPADWLIISDVDGARQEFITQNVVPEPETVILLVTGLLALGAVAYFRGISA